MLRAAWDEAGETQTQLCHDLDSCTQPQTAAAAAWERAKMAQPLFISNFVVQPVIRHTCSTRQIIKAELCVPAKTL